ncbi:MAG: hypothetical protein KJ795_11700 [Gammaproteobacteria bacterium]|nr:hypothetical protein [Gammaproteobacteria bacterium]MBU1776952.1 hypothetical protein [Gammaproteobacteria bacterium]MBU1968681.1 hypothetical protein [Gammaproteobacteria bacterium]
MRFTPNIPPVTTSPEVRHVGGLIGIRAVKPVHAREQPEVEMNAAHQEALRQIEEQRRNLPAEDRRKTCRRTQHLPVLVELRSGVERRRHNLFEGGADEHVDIEA